MTRQKELKESGENESKKKRELIKDFEKRKIKAESDMTHIKKNTGRERKKSKELWERGEKKELKGSGKNLKMRRTREKAKEL